MTLPQSSARINNVHIKSDIMIESKTIVSVSFRILHYYSEFRNSHLIFVN